MVNWKIYAADDDERIRETISTALLYEGFDVRTFSDGDSLFAACEQDLPDLVILDIVMPGTDGLSVCSSLRRSHEWLPIIIVSAKDSPYDRVTGLTLGCDDYLSKPFLPLELVARVKALLRRARIPAETEKAPEDLTYGPLTLSPDRRSAVLSGRDLPLTPMEFDFLAFMMRRPGMAVSREDLFKAVWQVTWEANTRAADDLVKRLRRKLRQYGSVVHIETVQGYGFRLSLKE